MRLLWFTIFLILLCSLVSCNSRVNKVVVDEAKFNLDNNVVNDIFLMALDTPYYPYDDFLMHDLKTLQLKNETNLIAASNKLEPIKNLDSLTNIGRFKIVRDYDFSKKVNQGILGSIQFSRIAFVSVPKIRTV